MTVAAGERWCAAKYATGVGTVTTTFDYDSNGNLIKTTDAGGTYNPFNQNNALTIYATGVRKARRSDWIFVIAVLSILFLVVCAGIAVSIFILQQLGKFLFAR